MAADLAWAWLRQARADLEAASQVHDRQDESTACQAVAKYQQTVEKAVKAIVAAVADRAIMQIHTGFRHDVEQLISSLMRLPRRQGNQDVQNRIHGPFNEHHRGEIKAICRLAPKRPDPGHVARRNTEYPFQNPDGSWRAPSDPGSFGAKDVERFSLLAQRICEGSFRVVSAIYR